MDKNYILKKLENRNYADVLNYFNIGNEKDIQKIVQEITGEPCIGNSSDTSYNILIQWYSKK